MSGRIVNSDSRFWGFRGKLSQSVVVCPCLWYCPSLEEALVLLKQLCAITWLQVAKMELRSFSSVAILSKKWI